MNEEPYLLGLGGGVGYDHVVCPVHAGSATPVMKRTNIHGMWMLPRGRESRQPHNWLLRAFPHIHPSMTARQRHRALKRKRNRIYNAEVQWCREPGEGIW